jgi:nicotinamidase/pyrazinamidase
MNSASMLLVMDIQNDFLPGGALAIAHGDQVIPVINALAPRFDNLILTQDWHPPGHISFASSHPDKAPFDTIDLPYGKQILWPTHCVQGTTGAELATELKVNHAQALIRKGFHPDIDSYSAFVEADGVTRTGLASLLRERGISTVYCCGLATDFCVLWSALDARTAGFETVVITDACRAIDVDGSLSQAEERMRAAGIRMMKFGDG